MNLLAFKCFPGDNYGRVTRTREKACASRGHDFRVNALVGSDRLVIHPHISGLGPMKNHCRSEDKISSQILFLLFQKTPVDLGGILLVNPTICILPSAHGITCKSYNRIHRGFGELPTQLRIPPDLCRHLRSGMGISMSIAFCNL